MDEEREYRVTEWLDENDYALGDIMEDENGSEYVVDVGEEGKDRKIYLDDVI